MLRSKQVQLWHVVWKFFAAGRDLWWGWRLQQVHRVEQVEEPAVDQRSHVFDTFGSALSLRRRWWRPLLHRQKFLCRQVQLFFHICSSFHLSLQFKHVVLWEFGSALDIPVQPLLVLNQVFGTEVFSMRLSLKVFLWDLAEQGHIPQR